MNDNIAKELEKKVIYLKHCSHDIIFLLLLFPLPA